MIIGSKIFHKNKVYNSLDWAKQNINKAPDGAIFLADVHEHTRGRQGRIWNFHKDQLTVTILLKPENLLKIKNEDLPLRINQLNMAITLGILNSLEIFDTVLKWPNDFYFQDKKIGGVLSQVIWKNNFTKAIVFGLAINVNNKNMNIGSSYYKALSLSEIVGNKIDKESLFNQLLISIDLKYQQWLNFEFDEIFNSWKTNQAYIGKKVTVHKIGGEYITGEFVNVLPNGDMVLKSKDCFEHISFNMIENLF